MSSAPTSLITALESGDALGYSLPFVRFRGSRRRAFRRDMEWKLVSDDIDHRVKVHGLSSRSSTPTTPPISYHRVAAATAAGIFKVHLDGFCIDAGKTACTPLGRSNEHSNVIIVCHIRTRTSRLPMTRQTERSAYYRISFSFFSFVFLYSSWSARYWLRRCETSSRKKLTAILQEDRLRDNATHVRCRTKAFLNYPSNLATDVRQSFRRNNVTGTLRIIIKTCRRQHSKFHRVWGIVGETAGSSIGILCRVFRRITQFRLWQYRSFCFIDVIYYSYGRNRQMHSLNLCFPFIKNGFIRFVVFIYLLIIKTYQLIVKFQGESARSIKSVKYHILTWLLANFLDGNTSIGSHIVRAWHWFRPSEPGRRAWR